MRHQAAVFILLLVAACTDEAPADASKDAAALGDSADGAAVGETAATEVQATGDAVDDAPADTAAVEDANGLTDAAAADAPDIAVQAADATSATADAADASDATGAADAGPKCPSTEPFSYQCDPKVPATCPGGACLLLSKVCIGPKLDPHRWDDCGDSLCQACETAKTCPADCGPPIVFSGAKAYGGQKTLTVWVHGFSNQGPDKLKELVYGSDKSCGDLLQTMQGFGVKRPCGNTADGAKDPEQLASVEYYGTKPAAWMTPQDVAEIEKYPFSGGPQGLWRYAKVVAKYARYKMKLSGATHVQFACHSMGCLITRHLLEHDEEQLASKNEVVRWFSSTGVIQGAQLSRLFDNPGIQAGAKALGLELSDFILMNPDHVWDVTAAWDHKLALANNPLLGGILLHHVAASDPKIKQALGIQLLDLNNPADEPNDGIMFTRDMSFHGQAQDLQSVTLAGDKLPPTRSLVHADHMTCPETLAAGLVATAALFHKRKVVVEVKEVHLIGEFEGLLDPAPAELALDVEVRWPFVKKTFAQDVLVHDDKLAHRTAEVWTQKKGDKKQPGIVVFEGPVLDGMKELRLDVDLHEVDWYPKAGVKELALKPSQVVAGFHGEVELKDGAVFEMKNKDVQVTFEVRVHLLY